MQDCIFCKIAKGEIPATKIYEDNDTISFLDIAPVNKGHTLVITKNHYEILTNTPDQILNSLILATKKSANAVVRALNAEGYNLLMNNKKVSGQIVPHIHFHIIPRFENDGFVIKLEHKKYDNNNEMIEYQQKIRRYL